jgi:predicted nucleotidyltransferase
MNITNFIKNLPAILVDFTNISLIYLFGSQASGLLGPMSDYDVAILDSSNDKEFTVQTEFQHALVNLLNTERVDVVLLNRAPVELAYHIIASGKLLYQRDTFTRVEFEAQVLGKYGDFLPILREYKFQTLQGDNHGKRVQRYREALRRTERTLGPPRTPPGSRSR